MSAWEVPAAGGHISAWLFSTAVFGCRPGSVGWGHGLSGLMIYERRSWVEPDVDVGPRMSGREVDGSGYGTRLVTVCCRGQRNIPWGYEEICHFCSQMTLGLGDQHVHSWQWQGRGGSTL